MFEDLDVCSAWGLYGMHAPLSVANIYLMTFDKCAISVRMSSVGIYF